MQFWVYLLRCADGSFYAGHTDDLEGRLWQHNQGLGSDWAKRRRPVELAWCEAAPTRDEAFAFERSIKGWTRAKKEALIAGDWDRISWLSRSPRERAPNHASDLARPERSAAQSKGAGTTVAQRPSTSLRTSEVGKNAEASTGPEHKAKPEVGTQSAPAEGRGSS